MAAVVVAHECDVLEDGEQRRAGGKSSQAVRPMEAERV